MPIPMIETEKPLSAGRADSGSCFAARALRGEMRLLTPWLKALRPKMKIVIAVMELNMAVQLIEVGW
jgi:hypothetical protein